VNTLTIEVTRRFDTDAALYRLTALFVLRRPPNHTRSDNGPDFSARAVQIT
jgi:putative transposase